MQSIGLCMDNRESELVDEIEQRGDDREGVNDRTDRPDFLPCSS